MQTVDILIHAGWVVTCNNESQVLEKHSIAIHKGEIKAIFPSSTSLYKAHEIFDLSQHLVMPGLINAHTHAAMCLFRGLADDYPLMTWLEEYIWPAEQSYVDALFVEDGTQLAMAEMIRSGTTTFSDMYFFPEVVAQLVHKVGMRAQLTFPIFEMASNWGADAEDYLQKGLQLLAQYQQHPLISIALGPHAPYTVCDKTLEQVERAAQHYKIAVQMHLHETEVEVQQAEAEKGERPISRLAHLKLLNSRFQAVHMTTLSHEDIHTIARSGAHIIHCPESNLKLASGFCPVQTCINAGINVALGTDGAASNNDLDMMSEMRTAAMLAKAIAKDSTAINANTAVKMATINGAKALGIDKITGSLEVGKQADIIAIDFSDIEQQPVYNAVSHLVYTNLSNKVTHSWVNGNLLMKERKLTTINIDDCKKKAHYWQQELSTIARHNRPQS